MANPGLSDKQLREALEAYVKHGCNMVHAADAMGLAEATMRVRVKRAQKQGIQVEAQAPAAEEPAGLSEVDILKAELSDARAQLRSSKQNTLNDEFIKRKIIGIAEQISLVEQPQWPLAIKRGETLPGVPVAFWSDWHWAEVVYPEQINGINEFNLKIAHERGRMLVEKTIYLLRQHIVKPNYPGIVVALGGDMISGNIHEELENSNEIPIMPCLLDLYGFLVWALTKLADEFGKVFVPCVTGNHGRSTRKYVAKNRNQTSYDWLLYHFVAKHFEGDERFTFFIPDGPDALFNVAGHRFLLTHGDQFRSGEAIIGHVGAVIRGQKKKSARNSNIGLGFDTLIHGHFHSYSPTPSIIGNGSLKGMDEYAYQGGFGYEPPIQAMWLVHPEHGITIHMPIHLGEPAGNNAGADWVSWHQPKIAA